MRVAGIFTGTTISLSPRLRQRRSRYTIRAGQNLPDKEFRYLRTVMVTAAVYWDFKNQLIIKIITKIYSPSSTGQVSEPIHKFSFLQIPVFLLNSRHFLFCAIYYFFLIDTLSPEVTESNCLVPSILFTHLP